MDHEESKILKRRQNAISEGNDEQIAIQAKKLGELRTHQGRYDEALKYFKESLAACHDSGDRVKRGCAHRMVGEAYINLGNYEKALDHQTKYLQLVEKAGDILEQQRAWATIGRSQLCLGESKEVSGDEEQLRKAAFAAAKNAFQKSLVIANEKLGYLGKSDQALMRGRLILNLGLVYEYQGEAEKALTQLQKAVEMFRCHDLYEDWSRALGSLGALKLKSGDCEGALRSINKGIEVAKRLPADDKVARTADLLSTQAEVFFTLGELSSAKHALHKAYKMKLHNEALKESLEKNLQVVVTALRAEKQLQEIDDDDWLLKKKLHENIADCCIEVKAYKKAIDHYKKMLECSETLGETGKPLSAALVSVGETYKDYKQYDLALQYFEREYDLWEDNNPKEAGRSLLNIASVYKLKQDWAQQLHTLERARTQAVISGNVKLQLEVLNDVAAYHRSQKDEKSADEIENDILLLRGDTASSQETQSSQEQGDIEDIWESTNIDNLSSDASEDEERTKTTTRLRQRNTCKVKKNEKGETALHVACIKQNIGEVQKLLETGHPVNVQDNAGWTPLHEACNYGYVDIVEMLVSKGANVNHKGGRECDGYTPLHDAASNGCFDVIEVLLDNGADPIAKTYKKPYLTPYNILVNWLRDNQPLDEIDENNYQQLCSRMKQALEKVGQSVSEDTGDSSSSSKRYSSALRYTQASFPEPGPSRRSPSPQPSSSTQPIRKQPSYENRAIMDLKRKNKLRIASDASSHSEDDRGLARFGSLRRKADSTRNQISDDDDDEEDNRNLKRSSVALLDSSSSGSDVEQKEEERAPVRVRRRSSDDSSATTEYSRVMDTLRGKHKHKGAEPYQMKTAKPALLHEEDIEPDWLEDDLGKSTQPTKKLKMSTQMPMIPKPASLSRRSSSVRIESRTPSRSPSPMDMDADTEDIGPPSPQRKKATPTKRSPKKSPRKPLSPYKPSQKSFSPIKSSQRISRDQMDLQIKLKVQVNEDKFLVPAPLKDLTMAWLADEVAQRYYRRHGLLPKLSLQTKDGALLSSTDPISLLLSSKDGEPDELQAKVESLTLPPITARYKEACQNYECGEDVHLLKCLEACQVTLTLELSNLSLDRQSTPLLYALSKQHTLRELNLPRCGLGDGGLEKLCPVLATLEQLTSIDLSCNNISSIGLTHMGNLVADGKSLKMLNSLNLSHNPLDSAGLALLGPIFDNLSGLIKLELRDCGLALSEDSAMDNYLSFSLDAVTELDISHNALGCEGLGHFFGRVDAWQLSKLNVAYTAAKNQEEGTSVAREVALLLQKAVQSETQGGALSCLDISGCNLLDMDVYELLNTMVDCNIRVEHLILSCNTALTAITSRYLLQHNPCFKSLTLTGCPGLVFPMQPEDIPPDLNMLCFSTKQRDDAKSLSLTWAECKGEKAKEQLGPGGLVRLSVK